MSTINGSNGRKPEVVACRQKELQVKRLPYGTATIDVLPDDVLLNVFDFYLDGCNVLDAWHKLVHVCRRWRQVVFASPRRLKLRLLCTSIRPVKTLVNIWPALPIVIDGTSLGSRDTTNIDAALKHYDRVCEIVINNVSSRLLNSMKESFPSLTDLELWSTLGDRAPVLPDSFMDGSAPGLRNLILGGIPFPGLYKLLLSTRHLVQLFLLNIPDFGFISPEAMVTCLASLTSLEKFTLAFLSPRPLPDRVSRRPPPLTRAVLPALTRLRFQCTSEYLEDIVARIDSPLLNYIDITFLNLQIFDTPLLLSFISRTDTFKIFHRAEILCSYHRFSVTLLREGCTDGMLLLGISCIPSDWRLSSVTRVCNLSLPPLPTLEQLEIHEGRFRPQWDYDVEEDTHWLELLHPFITVKSLYLDENLAPRLAPALQKLAGARATEVLPALQNMFVQGPVQPGIAQFITTRQLLGRPVAVQGWDGKGTTN